MRKSVIGSDPADEWMDLERVARVEVSSEEPEHPVEAALIPGRGSGWRASRPGPQTVRLVFDGPRQVRRVRLRFVADAVARTQEFVLRWVDAASEPREVVRQQWNFAADGSAEEVEDYRVGAGLIDELHIAVSPVLLGRGEHLFGGVDLVPLGYECSEHVGTPNATHVVIRKKAAQ